MSWGRDERVDDIFFEDLTSEGNPTAEGQVRRVSNDLLIYIDGEAKSLTAGSGGGITEGQHEVLDTLVHDLSESYYLEVTRSSGRITDVIAWTNSGKTQKVREINITRTTGLISQVVEKQYDGSGTLKYTMTYTISRTGSQVSSVDVVKT